MILIDKKYYLLKNKQQKKCHLLIFLWEKRLKNKKKAIAHRGEKQVQGLKALT